MLVDLFLFMGQSNMAGRGISNIEHPETAPSLIPGAGYEYRAVSSPDALHVLSEPFGRDENRFDGIDDGGLKTGSMVTAFVNAYFKMTGTTIIGVSASKGGSCISQWQPGGPLLTDAIGRLKAANEYLVANGYTVRHRYMLWCQGESDGDIGKTHEAYRSDFENMLDEMRSNGIETCFLVQIGHYNGSERVDYTDIMNAQTEISRTNANVVMVSTSFADMKERGLMKDAFHYVQQAYNEVGTEAGIQTALHVNRLENRMKNGRL